MDRSKRRELDRPERRSGRSEAWIWLWLAAFAAFSFATGWSADLVLQRLWR